MNKQVYILALCAVLFVSAGPLLAIPLTGVNTTWEPLEDSSDDYSVVGEGDDEYKTTRSYSINFNQGTDGNDNLLLNGVSTGSVEDSSLKNYVYDSYASMIKIRRVDNAQISGDYQLIFYELDSKEGTYDTTVNLAPSKADNMAATLNSRITNRGSDNVFANTGTSVQNRNNIERLDFIFSKDYVIKNSEDLVRGGFVIMERGGNDYCYIAAITSIDAEGNPASYGSCIKIGDDENVDEDLRWGDTGVSIATTILRGDSSADLAPSGDVDSQNVFGIFVTMADLGISADQHFYGYSLFAGDLTTNIINNSLLDWTSYSTSTGYGDGAGGLDLLAGGSIMYTGDNPFVPEPATMAMIAAGFACLAAKRRHR